MWGHPRLTMQNRMEMVKKIEYLRWTQSLRALEGNLKSDCSYFTQEEPQRETESIDGGGRSCPQSPTDVSISSSASSSLSSRVGRKCKGIAAEKGEKLHIKKENWTSWNQWQEKKTRKIQLIFCWASKTSLTAFL